MKVLLFVESILQSPKRLQHVCLWWHVRCPCGIQFHNPDNNLESLCLMRNALVHASILICTVLHCNLKATIRWTCLACYAAYIYTWLVNTATANSYKIKTEYLHENFTHSRSWALLKKLPTVQLLKNFPAFYGIRRFITVFTGLYPEPDQSNPHHPIRAL
jgi:hypothetical protein